MIAAIDGVFWLFVGIIAVLGVVLYLADRKPQREQKYNRDLWDRSHEPQPTPEERKAIEEAGLTVQQWREIKYRDSGGYGNNPFR